MEQKSSNSKKISSRGLLYSPGYISSREKSEILEFLQTLYPLWEQRFSKNNPPGPGQEQRQLLRPVYWLGNWQFACLNYYHPPQGIFHRCVEAEGYPPVLARLVEKIESLVHSHFESIDIPRGWHLNTCLINYYGNQLQGDKKIDCARVGEHKDFEPGPVASVSFGERALFQFISSRGPQAPSQVILQQWLDDSSLQIFGGPKFKKHLFHRVQRVDKKEGHFFPLNEIENFETRRINFTFRYVPNEHIVPFRELPEKQKEDVQGYVRKLAERSVYFQEALTEANRRS